MPYGVECDQYSVLGEITELRLATNDVTGEKVYILTIAYYIHLTIGTYTQLLVYRKYHDFATLFLGKINIPKVVLYQLPYGEK